MTVSVETSRVAYSGDAVTVAFSFPYKFVSTSDIKVVLTDEDDGSEAEQTLSTHYTVSGAGLSNGIYASGTVTFVTAPGSDKKVILYRDPAFTQETDLTAESNDELAINRRFDIITMQLQRLEDARSRSIRLSEGFWSTFDATLPDVDSVSAIAGMAPVLAAGLTGMTWATPVAGATATAAMAAVLTEETTDEGLGALNGVLEVATKAALSALTAAVVDAVVVRSRTTAGDGYAGTFIWRTGDQSANVTADPAGALWVAPDAASTGASGAWQRFYNSGAIQDEWFGPAADGATDDLTPLSRFINAVMASEHKKGLLRNKVYAISGALPQINVPGVVITGVGASTLHSAATSPGVTTEIKAITNSGFTMLTVAPTEGATNQRVDAVKILGLTLNCNSLAAKGLLVKSVTRGEFTVTTREATTSGVELDVGATLGEANSLQQCTFDIQGRQFDNAAPALRLKGDANGNTSFNTFKRVTVSHFDGSGVIVENADNNLWDDLRIFNPGGGLATYSIEWLGHASSAGRRARAERIRRLSATLPGVVRGTSSYTYPATDIVIDELDLENGTPNPVVEVGATARWGTPRTDNLFESAYNLIVNGDFALNQLAPATNADKTAGFDGGVVLVQTDTIALSSIGTPETGQAQALRMTQSQAVAQRMGYMFVIPSDDTVPLRGQGVAIAARIRCSATTDIRCAILEWTGTVDAVAGDIVADWTSATYTTAGFFESTTKNVLAVSETAATAATWRNLSGPLNNEGGLTATVGASATNLIVFIWTEAAAAQNVTLDIGKVRFIRGYMPNGNFPEETRAQTVERCQRQVQKTYNLSVAPGSSTGVGAVHHNSHGNAQQSRWWAPFRTRMRTTPTCTVYSQTGASANVRDVTAAADIAASTTGAGEDGVAAFPTANTTTTNIITFHIVATAYPWT